MFKKLSSKLIDFLEDFTIMFGTPREWLNLFFPIDASFDISYVSFWVSILALITAFLKNQ